LTKRARLYKRGLRLAALDYKRMKAPVKVFDAVLCTGRMFNGLTVRVQWTRAKHGESYAWQMYFDDVCVESVEVAEAHLAMMRRIDKARSLILAKRNVQTP
jgi:hypothetical protein